MTRELPRGRRRLVRLLAAIGLLTFSFMLVFVVLDAADGMGDVVSLEPPGSPEARFGAAHPGEAVHVVGAVAAIVVGTSGLMGLMLRPGRAGAATQVGATAIAMLITIGLIGDPDNHGGQGLPVDPAFLVMAIPPLGAAASAAPWRAWRGGVSARLRLLALGALGLPACWYGVDQALMQRNTWPPLADPHHQAHWYAMSLLAFMIVLVAIGAALHGRGWRVAAFTAGGAAVAIGITSLLSPASASALPPAGAVGAALWGAAVIIVSWRESAMATAPSHVSPAATPTAPRATGQTSRSRSRPGR